MESPTRQAFKRFLKSPSGKVGLALTLALVLLALFIPVLKPYDPTTDRDYLNRLKPPSLEHPFGTDHLGRDIFTRVLHGSRISLQVGVLSVGIGLVAGTLLGLIAGFFRGRTEVAIGWLADLLLAFPGTLLAIAIVAVAGPSLQNAMIAIGVVQIPVYIRLARSMVLSLREQDFVQAAVALGAGNGRILFKHILPGTLPRRPAPRPGVGRDDRRQLQGGLRHERPLDHDLPGAFHHAHRPRLQPPGRRPPGRPGPQEPLKGTSTEGEGRRGIMGP